MNDYKLLQALVRANVLEILRAHDVDVHGLVVEPVKRPFFARAGAAGRVRIVLEGRTS